LQKQLIRPQGGTENIMPSNNQPMKREDQHDHSRIQVVTRCEDCGEELAQQTFNRADLETQQMSELPNRENMSLVNANVAAPINAALALNVLSDGSIASAQAIQNAPITQGIG
jgi:hypothetical protein